MSRTVRHWCDSDPDFAEAKDDAMREGFDRLAAECLDIIDDSRNDWVDRHSDRTGEVIGRYVDTEAILRSKARVDVRLRLLAVWDRAGYGPQQQVKVDANVAVTETTRHVIDPRSLDDTGRAALRALLAQAEAAGLLPPPDDEDEVTTSYSIVRDNKSQGDDD